MRQSSQRNVLLFALNVLIHTESCTTSLPRKPSEPQVSGQSFWASNEKPVVV